MSQILQEHWNTAFIENTKGLFKFDLALEIGCFTGITSRYICENLLTENGKLICVDPLEDQYLVEDLDAEAIKLNEAFTFFNGQYDKFIQNTKDLPLQLIRNTFAGALFEIEHDELRFDFVYVDGDHREEAVYFDGANAFRFLKRGGFMLFDDYLWNTTGIKAGIDRFLSDFESEINVVSTNYQVLIQKIK